MSPLPRIPCELSAPCGVCHGGARGARCRRHRDPERRKSKKKLLPVCGHLWAPPAVRKQTGGDLPRFTDSKSASATTETPVSDKPNTKPKNQRPACRMGPAGNRPSRICWRGGFGRGLVRWDETHHHPFIQRQGLSSISAPRRHLRDFFFHSTL